MSTLSNVARSLVAPGQGILAADESTHTIEKRFAAVGLPSSAESRRGFRELLLATPGISQYLHGVIFYDETFHDATSTGETFVALAEQLGIFPGIKVDLGTEPLPDSPEEFRTKGLDDLPVRLRAYAAEGARFTKWRAVFRIGENLPSAAAIVTNSQQLAEYAMAAQSAGLVPIVEPELLTEGRHSLAQCAVATDAILTGVFSALSSVGVDFNSMILKPNMITAGSDNPASSTSEVAEATIRVLSATVPHTVAGIAFLSGGQSAATACERLSAMNQSTLPWPLSFSFGRALENEALKAWAGQTDKVPDAQAVFLHRAQLVGRAALGQYSPSMEVR